MMFLDFPDNPVFGDLFFRWRWDSEKWVHHDEEQITVFEDGTVALFFQPTAPTGWTKLTTLDDRCLRVVSGSGGNIGGSAPFSTAMAQTSVGARTLSPAQLPAGIEISTGNTTVTVEWGMGARSIALFGTGRTTTVVTHNPSGVYHTMASGGGFTGWVNQLTGNILNMTSITTNTSSAAHDHPIMLDVAYIDLIAASKD